MDIRTKLVFTLVAVALASMTAVGLLMSGSAERALREAREAQLDGLAESEKDALDQISAGWVDRVQLIATRTRLRESLRAFGAGDRDQAQVIGRILEDALSGVGSVRGLAIHGVDGALVAAVPGPVVEGPLAAPDSGVVANDGLSMDAADEVSVLLRSALHLEGQEIGVVAVRVSGDALVELTEDRTGLGTTGETMILVPRADGSLLVLRPGSVGLLDAGETGSDLIARTLADGDPRFVGEVLDTSGEPVWAAVRRIEGLDWRVVVKMDAEEGRAPATAFRERLVRVAIALAAFVILLGTVLGLYVARPITELADAANRIRRGDLEARAPVVMKDEVGMLARTFNEMADELERQVTLLREFEMFFELSLDLLCIAGTDGYLKRVNPAFERTLGWTPEELTSRPLADFVHPYDVESTVAEIEKLAEGVPTVSFENRWRRPDGTYVTLHWTSHPEPESGMLYAVARPVGAVGAPVPVSETDAAEALERASEADAPGGADVPEARADS